MATLGEPGPFGGVEGAGAPQGFRFATRDPERFAEAVGPVAGDVRVRALAARGFEAEVQAWRLPRLALFSVRMREGRVLQPDRDFVSLTLPLRGHFRLAEAHRKAGFAPGAAHLAVPSVPFDLEARYTRVIVANFESRLVRGHLCGRSGAGSEPASALASSLDARGGAGATLSRALRWVWGELPRRGSALRSPHLVTEVEDMLAETLVEAAGRGAPAEPHVDEARLRCAEEFLLAHLGAPVALTDVAAAADLSVRSLTRGFQRRHGVGPIGFLRARRLEAARRELETAGPGADRVTRVALRYGFAHMGRFAAQYRQRFGELPSETLRRG